MPADSSLMTEHDSASNARATPGTGAARELRILSGVHAGARLSLPPTRLGWRLFGREAAPDLDAEAPHAPDDGAGSDDALDHDGYLHLATLNDDGFADHVISLALTQNGTEWSYLQTQATQTQSSLPAAANKSHTMLFGEIVPVADVALTIDEVSAPWPSVTAIAAQSASRAAMMQAESNEFVGLGQADGRDELDPALPGSTDSDTTLASPFAAATHHTDMPGNDMRIADAMTKNATGSGSAGEIASNAEQQRRTFKRWRGVFGALIVIVLLGLLARYALLPKPGTSAQPEADTKQSVNQSTLAVTNLLKKLGLSPRLYATQDNEGMTTVLGWVHDEAERDAVARKLSLLSPMPGMRVLIESVVLNDAKVLVANFGPYISVAYEGSGKLSVRGAIESEQRRTDLIRAFAAQFPSALTISDDLLSTNALVARVGATLRDAGIAAPLVSWSSAHLLIDVPANTPRARLDAVMLRLQKQYGERLPILPRIGDAPAPTLETNVPFVVKSVSSGRLPFVELSDDLPGAATSPGIRLLPGGVYRGYTLISVGTDRLVFEHEHNRITLMR